MNDAAMGEGSADRSVTDESLAGRRVLFIVAGMLTGAVARAFVPAPSLDAGTVSGSVTVPGVGKVDLGKLQALAK